MLILTLFLLSIVICESTNSEGIVVNAKNHSFLIDSCGNILSKDYSQIETCSDNMYRVIDYNGNWGIIDCYGGEIIKCKYAFIGMLKDSLLRAYNHNGKAGWIDLRDSTKIPFIYEQADYDFTDGLVPVRLKSKYGFINKYGETVIPFNYYYAYPFCGDIAPVIVVDDEEKCGYINKQGDVVIPLIYPEIAEFKYGLSAFWQDGTGCIDSTGRVVIEPSYYLAIPLSNDYVEIYSPKSYGIVTRGNKVVLPCEYQQIATYNSHISGIVGTKKKDKWGFKKLDGKTVTDFIYDGIFEYCDGIALVLQNEKWGGINMQGEQIIPYRYDNVKYCSHHIIPVMSNYKWGAVDSTGEIIVPIEYEHVAVLSNGYILAEKNNNIYIFNNKKCILKRENIKYL